MHDTKVDKYTSELVREGCNKFEETAKQFNWDIKEVICGLKPAVDEFVREHHEWEIERVYTNNNGLTILRRKDPNN